MKVVRGLPEAGQSLNTFSTRNLKILEKPMCYAGLHSARAASGSGMFHAESESCTIGRKGL